MTGKKQSSGKNAVSMETPSLSHRDRLVEVGASLMRQQGFGSTGLQEILAQAGVPKGSFYHHFGSKEGFAIAVIEQYAAAGAHLRTEFLVPRTSSPVARLRRYFERLIEDAKQSTPLQGCLLGNLSSEVATSNETLQKHLATSLAEWQKSIASVLREAVHRGELPKSTKVNELAGYLLNSWQGALLRMQASQSPEGLNEFVRYTFDVVLNKRP